MAEDTTVETPETPTTEADATAAQAAREAAFHAGYEADALPEKVTQPTEAAVETTEQKETVEAPAGPKTVQLTEEDYKRLTAWAEKAPDIEQRLARVLGTVGTVQEQIGQLRNQKGRVRINGNARDKFPELAELLDEAEVDAASTATPPASQAQPVAVDHAKLKEEVKADLLKEHQKRELALLDHLIPNWAEIVGKSDSGSDFRKWLANQPEKYRNYIESAQSAETTAKAIRTFQASLKPKATPAREAVPDRRRDAIPPRGAGSAPLPTMPTRQDAFREGWRTG